ncbi:chorismate synthase [Candidatus Methanoplasma termitum]|uniref:Chorismate synthase n=1 Tax=Candidatus Methanoplasma termitum TaxID=1577791 RepID=A0A0A7LCE2_9ARCH|nr:chorismate synthase [Candidatus Methanoplasma termitum]AIZ56855.1 chorismate synthase [Candidatus Methanoplasma termitum]
MYKLGDSIVYTLYGESHAEYIGGYLEGIPKGMKIDIEQINKDLALRKPSAGIGTPRKEPDEVEFLSGLDNGKATGEKIHYRIKNTNTDSSKYDIFNRTPRPGHADLPALIKFPGHKIKGGNQFSGRLTVSVVVAGSIARQFIAQYGINVGAFTRSIGNVRDEEERTFEDTVRSKDNPTRAATKELDSLMNREVLEASAEEDSVGGVVECITTGLPIGFGGTWFGSLDAEIARAVFAIPACKGVEFGRGFELTKMKGSESNDPFYYENGVRLRTNNMGGILGGMSDGAPMVFRAAFKPTPSIGKEQDTIDLKTKSDAKVVVKGRHDPCIVPRAVVVVESVTCLVIADEIKKEKLAK